jgi:hypothetical protein
VGVPSRANVPNPLVPSNRAGAPGSEAPNNTSGSNSSPELTPADPSVGIKAVSGRASEAVGGTSASTPRSKRAPCESRSSSGSERTGALLAATAAGAGVGAGIAIPIGSSTGRSARGSKFGRETASIIFEPESGDQS